jgi:hypothetical protein
MICEVVIVKKSNIRCCVLENAITLNDELTLHCAFTRAVLLQSQIEGLWMCCAVFGHQGLLTSYLLLLVG